MTNLWIKISNADAATRRRAATALIDADIPIARTWLGDDDPELLRHAEKHLDQAPRRDPFGMALGAIFAVGFGCLSAWLVSVGGWWIAAAVPAALAALLGVAGFVHDATKKPRPAKKEND